MLDPVTATIITSTIASGLSSILGGSSGSSGADRARRERLVQTYLNYLAAQEFTKANNFQLQHPELVRDVNRGKYDYLQGALQTRGGITRPTSAPAGSPGLKSFIYRAADSPLRSPIDQLPAIGGPLRKVATGALRVSGPASWALLGVSLMPTGWIDKLRENVDSARFGVPAIPRGGAAGSGRPGVRPGTPPRPTARAPVRPAIQPITVTSQRLIAPVVVTARKINPRSGPVVAKSSAAKVPWWEKILGPLQLLLPKGLPSDQRSASTRIDITNSPFALPPAQPSAGPLEVPSPLTPFEGGSADCACPKKPSKPRKARTLCRTGRFIERSRGLQKYSTRKVPCRPSRKKQR